MIPLDVPLALLRSWSRAAERWWYPIPGRPGLGCYGSGYNSWGVQTNQKYLAGLSALAARGDELARERALAALRFSLATHHTGDARCTDGSRWGRTWISALGIERMMFAIPLLDPFLTDADRATLHRVLADEAHWLCSDFCRGSQRGIVAGQWNASGCNQPESNLWNGAILWRAAAMMPRHPEAALWRDTARTFLVNSVSVPDDLGRPRCVGANFFPNYGLDHHGYFNVGYMVICVSNAAMLHFDLRALGLPRPDELDQHQRDLWAVLRRMIFSDGRLARIGGDSRLRYTYCQDYLLPALFYAADVLGDAHAPALAEGLIGLMAREQDYSGDGSFYGRRLASLSEVNPYYYTRLESDRACVLAMALAYAPFAKAHAKPTVTFDESVEGGWAEPEHGAVLHRSATRLASFSWRAFRLGQGLCVPPGDSALAEWQQNLCGIVRFPCDLPVLRSERTLQSGRVASFPGGFLASGEIIEGAKVTLNEGWAGEKMVSHRAAFAALPDRRTFLGLEMMRTGPARVYLIEAQGMHLCIPNDLYNGQRRHLAGEGGETDIAVPAPAGFLDLAGPWLSVDGKLSAIGLYGAQGFRIFRADARRAGPYQSLYVEEIAWNGWRETRAIDADTTFLDVGWAVASGIDSHATRRWARANASACVDTGSPWLRRVRVRGLDGTGYDFAANFGGDTAQIVVAGAVDCVGGEPVTGAVTVAPGEARLFALRSSG